MSRFLFFFRIFRRDLLVMLYAMRHRGTPKGVKFLLLLAMLYLVSPVDLVPDTLPVVGWIDDAAIVPAAICGLTNLLPRAVRADCEAQADRLRHRAPWIILVASLLILAWVAFLIWLIARLF